MIFSGRCNDRPEPQSRCAGPARRHYGSPSRESPTAAISKHVVRVTCEHTGRGPTKARTYLNDNIVTVVLKDTLTQGERSLVRHGLGELVLMTRNAYQGAMRHDLVNGIEEILGRKVTAFLSDNQIDPDVAVEVFLLTPIDAPTSSSP